MLKRLFSALTTLTANIEAFAASISQADQQFRDRLSLDHREDVPQLPEPAPEKNGRRAKTSV